MNNNERKYFEKIFDTKIKSKKSVINLLRKKYNLNYQLTNINELNYVDDIYKYNYNYQRFDSNLSYNDFEETFYNIKETTSKTIFTNCGMSSIFALLFSLSKTGKYKIKLERDSYFETQQLIKKLNLNFGRKIMYLDSISNNFKFECNRKNSIVIIDTTCYHPHEFEELIKILIKNNNLCILTRSHVKLDMLGLEYTFLGSITFLLPKELTKKRFNKIKNLIKNTIDFCGNIGIIATEKNIFPILNDKEFINLNKARVKRIRENNLYFYKKIKNYKIIKLHKHNLFSTIIINNTDIDKTIEVLKKEAKKSNGLFFYSGSFGLDYIAVDTYFDLNDNKNTIRISIGDVDKDTINKFVDYLKNIDDDQI